MRPTEPIPPPLPPAMPAFSPPPVVRRKQSPPVALIAAAVVALLVVVVGVGLFLASHGSGPVAMVVSPEKAAVRKWLKDNTPTGNWEEIEWKEPAQSGGRHVVKYRTENPFGGMTVHRQWFRVKDGEAVLEYGG